MAHRLHSLIVDEVSLVDAPACAEVDPRTGRKIPRAVIAVWKRDGSANRNVATARKEKAMEFSKILKSAADRDAIVAAVEQQAEKVAKREGCSMDKARAKVWYETGAHEAYERAPLARPKQPERRMAQITKSEAELDELARQRVRKAGVSFAKACALVLDERPELYDQYQKELAAGKTYLVPEPEFIDGPVSKAANECPECDGNVAEGDAYCRNCGAALA